MEIKKKIIILDKKLAYGTYLKCFIKSNNAFYYSKASKLDTSSLSRDSLLVLMIYSQEDLQFLNLILLKGFKNILVCSDVYDKNTFFKSKKVAFVSLKQLKNGWINEINTWLQKFNMPESNSFSIKMKELNSVVDL